MYFSIVANLVLCLGFVYFRTPSLPDGRRAVTGVGTTERQARDDVDAESMRTITEALKQSSEALEAVRSGNFNSVNNDDNNNRDDAAGSSGGGKGGGSDAARSWGGEVKMNDERRSNHQQSTEKKPVGFSALAGAMATANGGGSGGSGVSIGKGVTGGGGGGGGGSGGTTHTSSPTTQPSESESLSAVDPWITIGIPTAPRNQDVDYLTTTLETLMVRREREEGEEDEEV